MSEMGVAMMGSATASGDDRAQEAAHAAISSPLLEDIDIHGAKGILVNVTAGMDMSIGEFSEVGDIVNEYASDDATVVIGTVLDPEMQGDLRVTMVATGIGEAHAARKPVRPKVVHSQKLEAEAGEHREQPTVIRNRRAAAGGAAVAADGAADMDYLDIPAFLRRQAD